MPSLSCQAGDTVFIRALVIEAASDAFNIVIEDVRWKIQIWVPSSEVARREDIDRLRPIKRTDRYLER